MSSYSCLALAAVYKCMCVSMSVNVQVHNYVSVCLDKIIASLLPRLPDLINVHASEKKK